jgi:succinoglycan biosynthesis transport protein ExoP
MRIGINSPQAFFALLIRRKWWILLPFLALSGVVLVVSRHLPRLYVSSALILIPPRDIPADFVVDLIAGSVENRLKSIEQTVLSRKILVQIIQEFGPELPELRQLNMDEQVETLRGQISIPYQTSRDIKAPTVTSFNISYQNRNPVLAQKIASKLTQLFIEEDNRTREDQVSGTKTFLAGALETVEAELHASESRLKDMKASRQFELPERLETNLRRLESLAVDKRTNEEALGRNQVLRLNLEQLLADTPPVIPKIQTVPPTPRAPLNAPLENPRIAEYRKAKLAFEELEGKPPANPDRQRAQLTLNRAKAKLSAEEFAEAEKPLALADSPLAEQPPKVEPVTEPNPRYQSWMASLREAQKEFEILQNQKALITAEIDKYNRRIENTPETEQQIADVQRETTELQNRFADLKGKLSQAQLSEKMESEQKGQQFVVVDTANLPIEPSKPNTKMVALAGVGLSLALALAFAIGVDVSRQRIWTQAEVETFWGVPVLIDIPEILTDSDVASAQKSKRLFLASLVIGAVVYSGCLYGVHLKHGAIIRHLDPVLQMTVYK